MEKVKNGATITITSRGRVVARLVPVEDERAAAPPGCSVRRTKI
ncbi:MAG: type II toxin-antitoxin system prevent-host-death family antitoxin [Deltaproteobacteria bacterium]|nr:type II toxin-antitoxin system prevent-host-death family antitoxin [Deltaproteobacteria bacterium]